MIDHTAAPVNYQLMTSAAKRSGRSFRDRLVEHSKGRFWYHANLSVALGTPDSNQKLMPQDAPFVEPILVAAHKPALNRVQIDCAIEGFERFSVRNWDSLTHVSMGVRATTGGNSSIVRLFDLAQPPTEQHHPAHVWLGEGEPPDRDTLVQAREKLCS